MLKYCLLANLVTTTLLLSLVSFFATVEHNMLQTTQAEIHPTVEEIIKEENSLEEEFINANTVAVKNKQFITTEDLVVINLTGQPIPLNNQELLFTGIVHPVNQKELEQKYNIIWERGIKQQLAEKDSKKAILVLNSVSSSSQK
ncbi:MAG: hypothetical protein QNJ34_25555 [Xenococcaceae cyanobacterium MO_188.B29]|nr:hypothetical protein [Xenococcaceae cyanobacterium MO_188.B29]